MNIVNYENNDRQIQTTENVGNVHYPCMSEVMSHEVPNKFIHYQTNNSYHEILDQPHSLFQNENHVSNISVLHNPSPSNVDSSINRSYTLSTETEAIIDYSVSCTNLHNKRQSDDYASSNKRPKNTVDAVISQSGNVSERESVYSDNMIYNHLLKSFRGKGILAAINYDKKMKSKPYKFDKYCHKLAMHVVENEFYNNNFDIKRKQFIFLREQICALADNQLPEEWYSPSNESTSARGYLYTAYKKLRGDTIELGIFEGTVKETSSKQSETSEETIYKTDIIDDKLKKYWIAQFDIRRKFYKTLTISVTQLIVSYPCLGCPSGFELILADFRHMYMQKETKLINIWPEFSKKILKVAGEEKSGSNVKIFLDENASLNSEVLAVFVLLYLLKTPRNAVTPIKGQKITAQEFVETFILQTKDFNDLEDKKNVNFIYERIKRIYDKIENYDVKPFIVVCGDLKNITAVYVVMNSNQAYKFDSIMAAVDVIVKCCVIIKEANSKFYKHITQFFEYYVFQTNNKGIYANVLKLTKLLNEA